MRLPLLLAAALCANACSPLDLAKSDAPRLYELSPKSTFDQIPEHDATLSIDIPDARTGLNTARIALRPTPTSLDYYADALWIDVVPNMIRTLVIESFDNTDAINLTGAEAAGAGSDFTLSLNVREFQAEYENINEPPRINVVLQAQLERGLRGEIVANETFATEVNAEGKSVDRIVEAYDTALGKVLKRLVSWTGEQMAANSG